MSEEAAVRVGVRMRPFNEREKKNGAVRCVNMYDNTTEVYNGDAEAAEDEPKRYKFDYSLWSHFDMENEPAGLGTGIEGRPNVDQQYLFDLVGMRLLENFWEGYDVCLFAYGQSGSGKSFSMTGTKVGCPLKWQGMIPRICRGVFELVKTATLGDGVETFISYRTTATMLEIYLDRVYDLLIPKDEYDVKNRKELTILSTGDVKGLTPMTVASTEDVDNVLVQGFGNQYKAPTGLNVDSSRGHTIFSLDMEKTVKIPKAKKKEERLQVIKTSMKLVDLAGSERQNKVTEITKDRLAQLLQQKYGKVLVVTDEKFAVYINERLDEGKAINGSLSNLGKCVSEVAKFSGIMDVKARNDKLDKITWRNSPLTQILKSALNGRCKTVMIAAVSPSHTEYPETISTLTYADNIKKIKSCATKKVAVETAEQKLQRKIKELEEQLAKAMSGPAASGAGAGSPGGALTPEMMEELARAKREQEEAKREQEESLKREAALAREMEAMREANRAKEAQKKVPHLLSILPNDSFLTPLPDGKAVAAGHQSLGCPIPLMGQGVSRERIHCTVTCDGKEVTLKPEPNALCMVNGKTVKTSVTLSHSDRLRLGANNYFRVVLPAVQATMSPEEVDNEEFRYTYDFLKEEAQKEMLESFSQAEDKESEEKRKRAVEQELAKREVEFKRQQDAERARVEEERARYLKEMEQMQRQARDTANQDKALLEKIEKEKREFERKMKEKEDLLKQKEEEEERYRKEKMQEEERVAKKRSVAKAKLQYDLMDAIPYVRTCNDYSAELNVGITFEIRIVQEATETNETIAAVAVTATDSKTKRAETWDMDVFRAKYALAMQEYQDNITLVRQGKPVRFSADSPFRVTGSSIAVIGHAKLAMASLHNMLELKSFKVGVILQTPSDVPCKMIISMAAAWRNQDERDDADDVDHLDELKELRSLAFDLKIERFEGLPPALACDVEASFQFPDNIGVSKVNIQQEELEERAREVARQAKAAKARAEAKSGSRSAAADYDDDDDDAQQDVKDDTAAVYGMLFKAEPAYPNHEQPQPNAPINYSTRIRIHNISRRVFDWLRSGYLIIKIKGRGPREGGSVAALATAASQLVGSAAAAAAASGPAIEVRVNGKTAQELNDELVAARKERETLALQQEQAKREAVEAKKALEDLKRATDEITKRNSKDSEKQQAAVVEAVKQGKVSADAELKKELLRLQEERKGLEAAREAEKARVADLEKQLQAAASKGASAATPVAASASSSAAAAAANGVTASAAGLSAAEQRELADLRVQLAEEKRRAQAERDRAVKAEQSLKSFKEEWDAAPADGAKSKTCAIA